MVYPYNLEETMELAIEALGYNEELLQTPFRLETNDPNLPLPPKWVINGVTTLRTCLKRLFDLQMIPRRYIFFHFSQKYLFKNWKKTATENWLLPMT